jgi:hypothetical protein
MSTSPKQPKIPDCAIISRLYLYQPRCLSGTIEWMKAVSKICPDARVKNEGPIIIAAFDPARVPEYSIKSDSNEE